MIAGCLQPENTYYSLTWQRNIHLKSKSNWDMSDLRTEIAITNFPLKNRDLEWHVVKKFNHIISHYHDNVRKWAIKKEQITLFQPCCISNYLTAIKRNIDYGHEMIYFQVLLIHYITSPEYLPYDSLANNLLSLQNYILLGKLRTS